MNVCRIMDVLRCSLRILVMSLIMLILGLKETYVRVFKWNLGQLKELMPCCPGFHLVDTHSHPDASIGQKRT